MKFRDDHPGEDGVVTYRKFRTKAQWALIAEAHNRSVGQVGKKEVWRTSCPRSGNKWPCARHELCTWCHNAFANKTAAELFIRHQMATRMGSEGRTMVLDGELTKTLPGHWHGIRKAEIWDQYRYFTKRSRNKRWMRWLRSQGAVGGIEFLEITQNPATGHWNLHSHDLLYAWNKGDIQIRPTGKAEYCSVCGLSLNECQDDSHLIAPVSTKTQGGKNYDLRKFGWGEQYSYDNTVSEEIAVGYLTKLAYAAKPVQFSAKVEDIGDLAFLYRRERPRLRRVWGKLRFSRAEKEEWARLMDEEER